ncbi:MAG: folylpolyglutamate synthase [Alyxoria varia]|nr:MAG: folylpolyglutamate synthase [Alyxoria varia]
MLRVGGVRTGRFLSPHLINRWDGITINNKTVDEALFRDVEKSFLEQNKKLDIRATPFEILTATAFQVFAKEKVQIAIIECGMGGLLDATNVLQDPLCTVITHIALDHVKILGPDIGSIAKQKAGIAKSGCPMVVAGDNTESCIHSIGQTVSELDVKIEVSPTPVSRSQTSGRWEFKTNSHSNELSDPLIDLGIDSKSLSRTEAENMALALRAMEVAISSGKGVNIKPLMQMQSRPEKGLAQEFPKLNNPREYAPAMSKSDARLPARYQSVSVEHLTGRKAPIIIDGAHNENSWIELRDRIEAEDWYKGLTQIATPEKNPIPITWIMATGAEKGKARRMIRVLTRPGDHVFATQYGPVEGMPQAIPASASKIEKSFKRAYENDKRGCFPPSYSQDNMNEVRQDSSSSSESEGSSSETTSPSSNSASSPKHEAPFRRRRVINTAKDVAKALWQACKTASYLAGASEVLDEGSSQRISPQSLQPSTFLEESPIIVTGSLYLCADVLRIIEQARDDPSTFSQLFNDESGVEETDLERHKCRQRT